MDTQTKPDVVTLYRSYKSASQNLLNRAFYATAAEFTQLSDASAAAFGEFHTELARIKSAVRSGDDEAMESIRRLMEEGGERALRM